MRSWECIGGPRDGDLLSVKNSQRDARIFLPSGGLVTTGYEDLPEPHLRWRVGVYKLERWAGARCGFAFVWHGEE